MKRNFILPSEGLNYIQHDCRLENLKYQSRSSLYDASLLSTLLAKTKSSVYSFYPNYLKQEENDDKKSVSSTSDTENKVIKEITLNNNDPAYGNIYWPSSVITTYNEDVIVLDSFAHRLIVFNKELIFKYQIGTFGSQKSQFNEPSDMVINEIGRLYVADKNNCRLQIFNETRLRGRYQKLSALKSGTEFTFNKTVTLNDKPVKVASAALASVIAVSTETGFVYILNDYNEIINFLKLRNFNLNDLKNILVNESGTEFISVRRSESGLSVKFYKIDLNDQEDTIKSQFIKKMSFLRKIKLESQYFPGVCLAKFNCLKFSVDLKRILVYDVVNLNLIEFDYLSGKFVKVLVKAENNMANVLDFDFTGNRLHLVCIEAEANKKFSLCYESNGDLTDQARNKFKSRSFNFKIKIYKYRDCECHAARSKSRATLMNRSMGYPSMFNFSLESYSADFNF
ncbi:E3 ubiquitin- ligase TRIM71-like [Brachionus plicatilis]|uniref:E3 ubiquitin-ligase TRIM71-like n=1 Tax=Brachionus plicatilis TaxID=10195 RepID=A0A3M7SHI6_BRAPC|nr:E3 ubiquitin- ligase TRIM71-like [Brachionus plicatilis]